MEYIVCIETFTSTTIEANSEEEAVKKVRDNLIAQKQMKECDPIKISVAREARLKDGKYVVE